MHRGARDAKAMAREAGTANGALEAAVASGPAAVTAVIVAAVTGAAIAVTDGAIVAIANGQTSRPAMFRRATAVCGI